MLVLVVPRIVQVSVVVGVVKVSEDRGNRLWKSDLISRALRKVKPLKILDALPCRMVAPKLVHTICEHSFLSAHEKPIRRKEETDLYQQFKPEA